MEFQQSVDLIGHGDQGLFSDSVSTIPQLLVNKTLAFWICEHIWIGRSIRIPRLTRHNLQVWAQWKWIESFCLPANRARRIGAPGRGGLQRKLQDNPVVLSSINVRGSLFSAHGTRARRALIYDDSGSNLDVIVVWTMQVECARSGLSPGSTLTETTTSTVDSGETRGSLIRCGHGSSQKAKVTKPLDLEN